MIPVLTVYLRVRRIKPLMEVFSRRVLLKQFPLLFTSTYRFLD
jgi:hypothetical protein